MNYTIDITKAVSKEAEEAFIKDYFGLTVYAYLPAYKHIFFIAVEGHRYLKSYLNRCEDNNEDNDHYKKMLSQYVENIQEEILRTCDRYKDNKERALEIARFIWREIEPLAFFSPIELKILFDMFLAPHASKE